ncbi:MAG: helix-turn-helix transcriptional regulator [Myxococcaceae bacterium]|nr:helix-turn-helix transcriptional regulator [Myxococcaceae bacterium]
MTKAPAKAPAAARSGRPTARGRKRPALPRHIEIRQRGLAATIGAVAKQARTHAGLTQQDVAEGVGIVPEVYGRIERGVLLPSVPTLFRLCVTLRTGPHELMGFAPLRGLPGRAPWAREVPPALAETPEMRRLLRLLGRLTRLQLKLMGRVAASLVHGD